MERWGRAQLHLVDSGDGVSADRDPLESVPDLELLRRHGDGDPAAFRTLFERHRERLWATAIKSTYSVEDAADCLQDAVVKAFETTSTFRGDAQVASWLHRIVVNACVDRIRRNRVRVTVPLPEDDFCNSVTMPDPSAAQALSLSIAAGLRTLPPEQAMAVMLVDMHGYSVGEAAAMMGVAEGTIKSRRGRARARLAIVLGEFGGTGGEALGTLA